MKHDIFISYSRKDYVDERGNVIPGNIVSKVKEFLSANGYSYWFDEEGIYSGDEFGGVIAEAIENAEVFLFISTKAANNSKWTANEIAVAREYGKKIIPFRVDDARYNRSVMIYIATLDYIDYYHKPAKAFLALQKSLERHLDSRAEAGKEEEKNVFPGKDITDVVDNDDEAGKAVGAPEQVNSSGFKWKRLMEYYKVKYLIVYSLLILCYLVSFWGSSFVTIGEPSFVMLPVASAISLLGCRWLLQGKRKGLYLLTLNTFFWGVASSFLSFEYVLTSLGVAQNLMVVGLLYVLHKTDRSSQLSWSKMQDLKTNHVFRKVVAVFVVLMLLLYGIVACCGGRGVFGLEQGMSLDSDSTFAVDEDSLAWDADSDSSYVDITEVDSSDYYTYAVDSDYYYTYAAEW